ncbi:hypothetical protein [Porphyromonas cangingivalis]|uniref:hypothetical protein n=1 Tax=Porphyromonas cangingivalis TaxID=36874 RepID=UPI0011DD05D6|nr:hypothetical protein [Porphyromonas cangingivalis]
MMKNKILILLLSALMGLTCHTDLKAQQNVLRHGGFEEFIQAGLSERPLGWLVSNTLFGMKREGQRPGGKGSYLLHVYANGGNFHTLDVDDPGNVPVEGGKAYRLTFWHKGNKRNLVIKVRFTWYQGETHKGVSPESTVKTSAETWVEEELYFRVPADADRGELKFTLDYNNGGQVSFDDVEMFLHEGDIPEPLTPPANIRATSHQREIEFTWDRAGDPKITWEVSVNNKLYTDIKTNSFTLDNLNPDSLMPSRYAPYRGQRSLTSHPQNTTVPSLWRKPWMRPIVPLTCVRSTPTDVAKDASNPTSMTSAPPPPPSPTSSTVHRQSFRMVIWSSPERASIVSS